MTVDVKSENNTVFVSLEGRFDSTTSPEVESKINSCMSESVESIIIDFEKVDFISSKGLRILVSLYKRLPTGDLRIKNPNAMVKEVFKLSGLLQSFKVQ